MQINKKDILKALETIDGQQGNISTICLQERTNLIQCRFYFYG